MIAVTHATDDDREDWDKFVDSIDEAESYHPYEWRKVLERTFGHKCIYLLARNETKQVVGLLPMVHLKSLLFGNFFVSIPCFNYCGALAENASVRRELVDTAWDLAKNFDASHVELRHRASVQLDLPYREDKVAMRLALPATSDELWKCFTSKLRAQVRRPGKAGATCQEGGLELLDDFYAVFSRNMRDLGTPVFPRSLFAEMYRSFPDKVRIFVVYLQDNACAAGITYGFRDRLEIPSASSLREYNKDSVNMLLYWSVLQYAIREGYRVFDFGRSTTDAGTYRFKKQWGAEPDQLHWHYCLPRDAELPRVNPDNPKYRLATKIWKKLPLSFANAVSPRIVKHLP